MGGGSSLRSSRLAGPTWNQHISGGQGCQGPLSSAHWCHAWGRGGGEEGVPILHAFTGVGPVPGAGSASLSWEGREGADSVPVPQTLIFLPKFVQIFWNRFSSLAVCPQDHFQRLKCCFHLFFCYNLHTFAAEWAAGFFCAVMLEADLIFNDREI